MAATTIHLLAVSRDLQAGWAVRARTKKAKLDRLIRAGVPRQDRALSADIWFVSNDYAIELREILAEVHDEVRFCAKCEQSEPCPDVWSKRMLENASLLFGDAREDLQLFDDIEDMIEWFETHRPPPISNPTTHTSMSPSEAAQLLGLTLPATPEQVDAAFKKAAFQNHPDRGGSNEKMAKIIQARAVLRGG